MREKQSKTTEMGRTRGNRGESRVKRGEFRVKRGRRRMCLSKKKKPEEDVERWWGWIESDLDGEVKNQRIDEAEGFVWKND